MRYLIVLTIFLSCRPESPIVIDEDGYPLSQKKKECMIEEFRNVDGVMFVICHSESEQTVSVPENSRVDW